MLCSPQMYPDSMSLSAANAPRIRLSCSLQIGCDGPSNRQAKRRYDLVVVDSPTLLNMADSRILASYVDSAVLIVRSRATPKILAKQACASVRGADAMIIGAVLNRLEIGDSDYSYSSYGYSNKIDSDEREKEHVSRD